MPRSFLFRLAYCRTMSIDLRPGENVFFPVPFAENEAHLLVITNQRVVQFGEEGRQELPAREVSFVGRLSERPFVALGVILAIIGLPLVGLGAYLFLSVKGMP